MLAQPGATASGLHDFAPSQSALVQGLVEAPAPAVSSAEIRQRIHQLSALLPKQDSSAHHNMGLLVPKQPCTDAGLHQKGLLT